MAGAFQGADGAALPGFGRNAIFINKVDEEAFHYQFVRCDRSP
jgi:hypothetical protein